MAKQTQRALQITLMIGLFFVSFTFFMFLTFPYEVLKESVAAQLTKETGYTFRIGSMGPALPLGFSGENIHIETQNGSSALDLKGLKFRLELLGLFTGKLGVSAEALAGRGSLNISVNFGLIDLAKGAVIPKRLAIESKNFPLDGIIGFAINVATSSPDANPMVAPLLSAVGVSGELNGTADFKLDAKNPVQSNGQADLKFANAILKLSNPPLELPDQVFRKALIKAKIENGSVVIDRSSGFVADELELLADGKILLKPETGDSQLDLKVIFRLNAGLKDKFGFLIDAVTGSATSEGRLTMQVRGSLDAPAVTTF
jgi:type II secretion system protein N